MTTVPKPTSLANTYTAAYDAWNGLVEIRTVVGESTVTVARFEYDGLNRRIKKHIDTDAPAAPDGVDLYRHFYYNSGWQLLETRKTTTVDDDPDELQPEYQYVWSLRYIDAPIRRDENDDTNDLCDDDRIYYLNDANMNVTTLVDTGGDALERYVYDAYGQVTIYDSTWANTRSSSSYDNAILYCGYYRDAETGLYHVRNRMYHPALGRWVQRDPIGYADGMNLYQYVRSRPTAAVDPSGTLSSDNWVWCAASKKSIRIMTNWCCPEKVKVIEDAVCSAFNTLHTVNSALWNHERVRPWTASHDITHRRLERYFFRRRMPVIPHGRVEHIRGRYNDVIDELDDGDGTLYDCAGPHENPNRRAKAGSYAIKLYDGFFYTSSDRQRTQTLIHELLHLYQQLMDLSGVYIIGMDDEGLPVYFSYPEGGVIEVGLDERLQHADTYSWFAMEWY